ncbi:MAG TPA: 4a-hydroxytetrahydrobiopterin dehydratase [Halomicronema sp.]
MAQLLKDTDIQERVTELSGWKVEGNKLKCQRKFKDFVKAIEFINRLVEPAEQAGHHPDLEISYNTVTISLTTHDAGGLTEADFKLAQVISEIV